MIVRNHVAHGGQFVLFNVAVSASIAMYELKRLSTSREIRGDEFI